MYQGSVAPAGSLGLTVVRANGARIPVVEPRDWPERPATFRDILTYGVPQRGLPDAVNQWRLRNLPNLWRGFRRIGLARALNLPHFYGQLWLTVIKADGRTVDLGLASMRVVTTAGVTYIAADMAGGANDSNLFKYHGIGTGATAEATGDTALVTELTTQYNPDSTRATGSQTSSTNVYTTVGTNTVDATAAITEHGIFTQAATGGGTLLDRSVFSVVNLASGDSLQSTYAFTMPAGS